jgi:hypothetical protein
MERGKLGSIATRDTNSSGRVRCSFGSFRLGLDKLLKISGRNKTSDTCFGTCGNSIGVAKIRSFVAWSLIAAGLTCVGCSSVLCSF